MEEATLIVGFFDKWDEKQRVEKLIRRSVLDLPFGTDELVKEISSSFMELARVKFK